MRRITISDRDYPFLLKQINDPPKILYIEGSASILNSRTVSIVGTRKITPYGSQVTKLVALAAANANITIVSGLAFGADSIAHAVAVKNKTPTIAVLPGGVDENSVYPREHLGLAREIVRTGGALISEYNSFSPTYPSNFTERNRIIAGLSMLTVVTEADFKSGAMITARHAINYGRDVASIPYSIFQKSGNGCNNLIMLGAHCLTNPEHLPELLGIKASKKKIIAENLEIKNKKVLENLENHKSVESLAAAEKIDLQELLVILSELEIMGIIQKTGSYYAQNKN